MFDRKYPEGSKQHMGPFWKGMAIAVLALVFKVCIGMNIRPNLQPDKWLQLLELMYYITLMTDATILFTIILVISKGNPWRTLKMSAGFLTIYLPLCWLIYLASKAATNNSFTGANEFFF